MSVDSEFEEAIRRGRAEPCALPNCSSEGVSVHVGPDGGSVSFCAEHRNQLEHGPLDETFVMSVVSRTFKGSEPSGIGEELRTRKDFTAALLGRISKDPSTYRAYISGPYFLTPAWLIARRNRLRTYPSFDQAQSEYLFSRKASLGRTHDVRFVLSLSGRYQSKVRELVETRAELSKYKDEVLDLVSELWGDDGDTGPDLLCANVGTYQIDYVFPEAVLTQSRLRVDVPTVGGWLYSEPALVRRSRDRFDDVFDANFRGMKVELQKLTSHIEALNI